MSVSEIVDEVPAGFRREWLPDDGWKLADLDRQCRMRGCTNQAVAALRRNHKTSPFHFRWWYYCADHMYGRKIEDGVVKSHRLVEISEAGAGPCAAGEPQA